MISLRQFLFLLAAVIIAYVFHPTDDNVVRFGAVDEKNQKLPGGDTKFALKWKGRGDNYTRIVAVGDFHGDFKSTVKVLKMAGIVNKELKWAAGRTVFVQTGDIVDRGPDTIALYKLMQDLDKQSRKAGGQVVSLLGNHEVMNFMDDLRFVDPGDFISFGGPEARKQAWSPEGELGAYLRKLDIAAWVNGTVFVHAGIHPLYAERGLDELNKEAREAISGKLSLMQMYQVDTITGPEGPLWYRGYVLQPESSACHLLKKALKFLKAERMVVGHTPQFNGRILARCIQSHPLTDSPQKAPRLYVIDVAISKAYGALGNAALEIIVGRDPVTGESRTVSVKSLYDGKEVVHEKNDFKEDKK
ncbi:hypothetical protein HK102_014015 [Quaeritorhiza haematococci]|nr:hypothetical protein HK102_014015 [Quaeritorhiza haematococci]